MKHYHILFVARSPIVEQALLSELRQQYEVVVARGRREALAAIQGHNPDLILMDVASVRFDLERFCNDLRVVSPNSSTFFLLGKEAQLDKLPKSSGYLRQEFTARQLLRWLARILPDHDGEMVDWQGLQLNTSTKSLSWASEESFLTPKQAELVAAFLRAPEQVLSRAHLMQEVWGTDYLGDTRTLDVHIHWLRRTLIALAAPFSVQTVRGQGYKLVATSAEQA